MNISYYTIDDLRMKTADTMKKFQKIGEALRYYRSLPDTYDKVLGMTDDTNILVLVRCLPIFPSDVRRESVLVAGIGQLPEWAVMPDEENAVQVCIEELNIRYMTDGMSLIPVPKEWELPRALMGYNLCLDGTHGDHYLWAYVVGRGRITPEKVHEIGVHRPLILKYWADAVAKDGMRCQLELEPWMYQRLLHHTLQHHAEQVRKNKEEKDNE